MNTSTADTSSIKNTTHHAVVPFYVYASLAFLASTIMLFFSTPAFGAHYFHPATLAITHTMALGWGTMIILGASHQLVPVLIESKLSSNMLAYGSFITAAAGIPLLVHAFWNFEFGFNAKSGSVLINLSILFYLVNLALSINQSKKESVHAIFIFTAAAWLLITTTVGMLLIFNFTSSILPEDSLHYLSLHAHLGIVGWFLLMVMGVGSRLIPMFLISKYDDPGRLWIIYFLINGSLAGFIVVFFISASAILYLIPIAAVVVALLLFINFCFKAYRQRIRKKLDEQMQVSLLSVLMMGLPLLILVVIVSLLLFSAHSNQLVLAYGFSVFFGWITAIIIGMTFKTLPFIVWNKIYHKMSATGSTPSPKDLFSSRIFNAMAVFYITGFILFVAGIFLEMALIMTAASVLLILTSILYNWNIMNMLFHKPAEYGGSNIK